MKRLEDEAIIWFGKHKGKKLVDIPLSYFRWLWENSDERQRSSKKDWPLFSYIALVCKYPAPEKPEEKPIEPPHACPPEPDYPTSVDEPNPFHE